MIYLSDRESLTDWMRDRLITQLTPRYKVAFMAMDMGVTYHQLWRFMRGEKMSEPFINKAFNFLLTCMPDVLEK